MIGFSRPVLDEEFMFYSHPPNTTALGTGEKAVGFRNRWYWESDNLE